MNKKSFNKLIKVLLVIIMVVNVVIPLSIVFADDDENYVFTFAVEDSNYYEITKQGGRINVTTKSTNAGNIIDVMSGTSDISQEVDIACNEGKTSCTVTIPKSREDISFRFNGSAFDITSGYSKISPDTKFTSGTTLVIKLPTTPSETVTPGTGEPFSGNATLIWSCKEGGVCFHRVEGIPNFDDGNSVFYKLSDFSDDATDEGFRFDAEYKGWATDDLFNTWIESYKEFNNIEGEIDWSSVDPKDIVGDPIDMRQYEESAVEAGACTRQNTNQRSFESCVDTYAESQGVWVRRARLQPLPDEPYDNNAYVSYGDRNFKIVIYNDEYKGVTLGDLSSLNYYPAYYTNPFIRQDQFDISGTTKNNPTVIDSILLESTVRIKTLDYNNFSIISIEALDVPDNAVTITKVDDEWKLVFSSNFYDNVVFKATDSNGGVEYFKIHRYTISGNLRYWDNKPVIAADFYFDRGKSYTDFDITAKIIYKDGTEKNVKMIAEKGIDDGLGNVTPEYEVDEQGSGEWGNSGKGLKKSLFVYRVSGNEEVEKIKAVYVNAEYKGSTDTTYAGAFSGSGKGVKLNIGEDD